MTVAVAVSTIMWTCGGIKLHTSQIFPEECTPGEKECKNKLCKNVYRNKPELHISHVLIVDLIIRKGERETMN